MLNSGNADTPPAADSSARAQGQCLEELAAILAEQEAKARQGDWPSVQALVGRSDALLRRLADGGPLAPQFAPQLARIGKALGQLTLILAAAKDDAARSVSHLGQGKSALRAYGRR